MKIILVPESELLSLVEHDEFRELCALSTLDCLSAPENQKLQEHLLACSECRNALKEYQLLARVGIPSLALDPDGLIDGSETSLDEPQSSSENVFVTGSDQAGGSGTGPESRDRRLSAWPGKPPAGPGFRSSLSYVVALVLAGTLIAGGFFLGVARSRNRLRYSENLAENRGSLLQRIDDLTHEQSVLVERIAARDTQIAELNRRIASQLAEVARVKTKENDLAAGLKDAQAQARQVLAERDAANTRARQIESELTITQKNFGAAQKENAEDEAQLLELRTREAQLRELLNSRDQTIARQQDLLGHDRDIRELMGARDLYIAEVYDVGSNGETQKPFGRVFYTKGKSLIFYAYDLDRQPGVRDAASFQAWGSRGSDRAKALNLGVFYVDNTARKRWVLKFDDTATLAQIDAVFVTVEPKGGSSRPSGRELLFAYLRIEPNHP